MAELQPPERPAFFLRKLQSETRFEFEPKDADAIISSVTYDPMDDQWTLYAVGFDAQEQEAIRASIAVPFSRPSKFQNGRLDTLPDTIFQDIVLLSDVRTVFDLRQVSTRTREIVDSVWQFERFAKHALTLYRTILVNNVGRGITLANAYELLIKKTCGVCGDCAEHVAWTTWQRLCENCVVNDLGSQYLTIPQIDECLYRNPATAEHKAKFKVIKAVNRCSTYWPRTTDFEQLVSVTQAKSVLPWSQGRMIRVPHISFGCTLTWMTICEVPVLDKEGKVDDALLKCQGCQKTMPRKGRSGQTRSEDLCLYDRESFLEHFRWCNEAQLIWQGSSKPEPESEEGF
ncbi:hypothetical protein ACHAPU_002978 [Fusarium lateritium]